MELFILGWKNVFRNKRRSILNIIALTVGVAVIIIVSGWVRGYFDGLYNAMINFRTGHIHIMQNNYIDEKRRLPLDLNVTEYPELRSELLKNKDIKEVTARIDFGLQLSNGQESVYLMGRGIDPERESKVTVIRDHIVKGNYLSPDGKGLLIGEPLADKMNLSVGDTVFLTARDKYNVENFIDAKITGIFNFGYPPIDDNQIFMGLHNTASFLNMKGEVSRVVIKLKNRKNAEEVLPDVRLVLKNSYPNFNAYNWKRFAQVMVSAVKTDTYSAFIMFGLLYVLIIIGILNSMSMSVQERTGEIATLRAIGMKRRKLSWLFLSEGISLGFISAIFAVIIVIPVAYYLQYTGFDVKEFMPEGIPIPWGERFTAQYVFGDYVLGIVTGVVTSVIGTLLPVRRAAKLNIAGSMSGHGE